MFNWSRVLTGGYPSDWSHVPSGGGPGGVPRPGPHGGGVPQLSPDGGTLARDGVPSHQGHDGEIPRAGMGYSPRSGQGDTLARMGYLPGQEWGTPGIGQQIQYLIQGGRYASCVHAGGLYC